MINDVYKEYLLMSLVILLVVPLLNNVRKLKKKLARQCGPRGNTSLHLTLGKHPKGSGVNSPFAVGVTSVNQSPNGS